MKYINIQTERFKSYDRLNESEKACLLDSIITKTKFSGLKKRGDEI